MIILHSRIIICIAVHYRVSGKCKFWDLIFTFAKPYTTGSTVCSIINDNVMHIQMPHNNYKENLNINMWCMWSIVIPMNGWDSKQRMSNVTCEKFANILNIFPLTRLMKQELLKFDWSNGGWRICELSKERELCKSLWNESMKHHSWMFCTWCTHNKYHFSHFWRFLQNFVCFEKLCLFKTF